MAKNVLRTLAIVLCMTSGLAAAAETTKDGTDDAIPNHPSFSDSFLIGIGAFYADTATNASYNSKTGVGTNVNFEDLLGLEDKATVGLISFRWKFADNWTLSSEYFDIRRDGRKALKEDISWGDVTYPAGSKADSVFNVQDVRVMVDYALFKTTDKEAGAGIGLHVMGIEASINATGQDKQKADVTAPLPVLSVYAQVALTDRWGVSGRIDWLSLNYQDYSGNLSSTGVDVIYQPFRHVGFAVGYRSLEFDMKIDNNDWNGRATINFSGPSAMVFGTF